MGAVAQLSATNYLLILSPFQRVHHVKTEGDQVYVKLSDTSTPVDSDRYFQEEFRELRENTLKEPVLRRAPLRVPLHSSRTGLK